MRELTPRRSERLPLTVDAKVRVVSGFSESATLDDISAEGCSLTVRAGFLQAGHTVLLGMKGLESLLGRVRWVKGPKAGVLFERSLHVAVVEHIARANPRVHCQRLN